MRKLITTAAITLAALFAPSTAGAAIVHANGGGFSHGDLLAWTVDYDTVANTVTLDVDQTVYATGQELNSVPTRAVVTLAAPNGALRRFGLGANTALVDNGSGGTLAVDPLIAKSDGQPGVINKGPQTYSLPQGLRVSANRAAAIDFDSDYLP